MTAARPDARRRERRLVPIDAVFAPYVIAVAMCAPLLIVYLAVPGSVFESEFSSRKWESPSTAAYYALAIVLFALGALAGDLMARRPEREALPPLSPRARIRLRRLCVVALIAAAGAGTLWLSLAASRAGGVGALLDAYRSDPQYVKQRYFASIAGVTTLTQLAVAAVPLAVAFRLVDRLVGVLIAVVAVLVLARSVLASERLALLEVAIPVAYLVVARRRTTVLRIAGVVGLLAVGVFVFFVVNELGRKGAYGAFSIEDAADRFGSYYLNSINNAFAIVDHESFATPLWFSTQAVWEFPGVSHLGVSYRDVFGVDATRLFENFYRESSVTPSVTTAGVVGSVSADFGWAGLLWILGIGGAAGALWQAGKRDPFYRALYAVWLVGVLEFVRIYYFPSSRLVPAYLVFAVALALLVFRQRSGASPETQLVARAATATATAANGGLLTVPVRNPSVGQAGDGSRTLLRRRRRGPVAALKTLGKRIVAPRLYPRPVSSLQPERLYAYLDALWKRRELDAAVVEVGCWLGGTAATAHTMLARTGFAKRYVCVDTFEGFVDEQFDRDVEHGTPESYRRRFAANSIGVVRRLLQQYGCDDVELVKGDIATLDPSVLPDRVAVCLIDVDLEVPVYEGLRTIYPRLVPGGIILVDDCAERYAWAGARVGYARFVREQGMPERYFMDMGIVEA